MNDFKKGLLVGIVIMSSIFLFIASTSSKMGSNDRREIVKYKLIGDVSKSDLSKYINHHIDVGWQPFGSLSSISVSSATNSVVGLFQPMVKYKED